ncbi:hypothetical protein B7463_g6983, partial [Scytalidium lignicola]
MMKLSAFFISYSLSWQAVFAASKGLWASTPASFGTITQEAYFIGNGRLGAMPFGQPGADKVVLNIDTLWSGGPFESDSYNGGNPSSSVSQYLPGIREWIFQNGTGNVSEILGDTSHYGSYQVYANLSVVIDGVSSTTSYNRSLNLDSGLHTTVYTANDGVTYMETVYCSYPDQVCVLNLSSNAALPEITIALENQLTDPSFFNTSCGDNYVRLTGVTQLGPPLGMKYDGIARLTTGTGTAYCSNSTAGALIIPTDSNIHSVSVVFGGGTDYDQTAGTAESNYSFRGVDPGPYVESVTAAASAKSEDSLRQTHNQDYQNLAGQFTLELPDSAGSAGLETSALISRYTSSSSDPYLENTIFHYGRHLFISSSRVNSLPPNLAGIWSETITAAWGADFHANINLQMNHWGVDQTGLGDLQVALWNYIQNTWVPRGTETAQLVYDSVGWVAHDELNIFGHTGLKDNAQWADYPASPAWIMQHVLDHFDYSQNVTWLQEQGYPLLKGVAQFWLAQLQPDHFYNDNTLVVNPCNSPEHGPTTFGCTHFQQLIHQLLAALVFLSPTLPQISEDFGSNLTDTLASLDTGLHIGTWGEIKEWKVPDSFGYDFENDTHRHLSNLYGWYPGHSVSSLLSGYTNATIQNAVTTSLYSRGPGNAGDANAGWEKVWRSACWALLNNTEEAYFELRYAIEQNFVGNLASMYNGHSSPFQIDANFGFVGATLSMLVVDLPTLGTEAGGKRIVVLGPAIPAEWGNGSVKGLRLKGGGIVDFKWDGNGVVTSASLTGREVPLVIINKDGKVLVEV